MTGSYRRCVRCIMDTTDPLIRFDANGVCSHCHRFERSVRKAWHPDQQGAELWRAAVFRMRRERGPSGYDCIIGVSGGIDSAAVVLLAHESGLNPLLVHVDAGWNSALAVRNIERLVSATGFDLATVVVDWESMRQLQVAYFTAGVINQDVPQDQAFMAGLREVADRFRIRTTLSGHNIATESTLPVAWGWWPGDTRNIRAIYQWWCSHSGHPTQWPLQGYPLLPEGEWLSVSLRLRRAVVNPLNWIRYDKELTVQRLTAWGWTPYPRKHGESRFTIYYQEHFLPERYGIDKRIAHLSSRILAGQLSRSEALSEIESPMLTPLEAEIETDFVARKLHLSRAEFANMTRGRLRAHSDFASGIAPFVALRRSLKRWSGSIPFPDHDPGPCDQAHG